MQGLVELPAIQSVLNEIKKKKLGADSPKVVLSSGSMLEDVALTVESLTLDKGSFNDPTCTKMDLSVFKSLHDVTFCSDVGYCVTSIVLTELKHLKHITVKDNCFTQFKSHNKGGVKQRNAELKISDCDVLKSIEIGVYSFADFSTLVISGGSVQA